MSKNKIWVSNTSPLIFLSKIDRLDVLFSLAQIWIPEAVFKEIVTKDDYATEQIKKASDNGKILVKKVSKLIEFQIDAGEKEAISLAIEAKAHRVLLDDDKARRFARRYSLNPIGTLGLLLVAKQLGLIPQIRPDIERLSSLNPPLRVTPKIIDTILKEANELIQQGLEPPDSQV